MPMDFGRSRGLIAAATAVLASLAVTAPVQAADFVAKCTEFATAANEGKPPPDADKICTCIMGKLSDSEQAASLDVLKQITDATKAGKEPAEPTGDKKAALQKFMDSGDTCSGSNQKK